MGVTGGVNLHPRRIWKWESGGDVERIIFAEQLPEGTDPPAENRPHENPPSPKGTDPRRKSPLHVKGYINYQKFRTFLISDDVRVRN